MFRQGGEGEDGECSNKEETECHQIPSDVVDSLVYGESPELGVVRTGSVGSGPFDLGGE